MVYSGKFWDEAEPDNRQRTRRMLRAGLSSRRFGARAMMVRNVSPGGLGGTTDQVLKVGERIVAELPNLGSVAGAVVWTERNRFGLSFDEEIDPDRVTRLGYDRAAKFVVMDRYRPDLSAKRPPIGLR